MSELQKIEASVEEKIHAALAVLESKLQVLFGSHPKIAEHVAEAHQQIADAMVNHTPPDEPPAGWNENQAMKAKYPS